MSPFIQFRQRAQQRSLHLCLLLLGILLLLAIYSLCAGEVWLSPARWFTPEGRLFVWQLRLPRTLAVILVGAALAVCGAVMQALFANPLAEPGLLGVSGGSGVGVMLCIMLGWQLPWQLSVGAISGAILVTLILLYVARQILSDNRLLLTGVALGIISSALMTWTVYFSTSVDLRQLMYWMMGGFSGVDWQDRWLMLALLPVILWLSIQGQQLNLLALGSVSAQQLGVRLLFWRAIFVCVTGWLVGFSVALAGAIGFIGLVIPHILRLCGISDHRALLPACALGGASVLLLADIIARQALAAAELPVGVVTATLGAPLFIWLLLRNP
ncbi:vitamin B12 ABC transporter permease BtuC [Izhakiella australiensis]|uniref:Vitamin B12 import system permease protein BtuC n=1 Tax=Izhakiella australiensis TaxID=1926881 RepID=A0A1S8YR04_9GAMM|nr:vitamin B12 ABC transporter permease BtuC [Izhakiella australiensis]OON41252.1 vitamin B12 ABC transporter permease BtuC [Izhakiella australiensis]